MSNRKKNKQKDFGLISSSGIMIEGDILLDCQREHSSQHYYIIQLILSFLAAFCTLAVGASYLTLEISYDALFIYTAMLTLSFGLLKSKQFIVKAAALIYLVCHCFYILSKITEITKGFQIVANDYVVNVTHNHGGAFSSAVSKIHSYDNKVSYVLLFFIALATLEAVICSLSCVYKMDFPILFIFTFPIVELGLYFDAVPNTAAIVGLFCVWITVLAVHIINHTTNKAGRKNTFAVHERRKTYYFTSQKAKAAFYSVYIRFTALLVAAIFTLTIIFSAITGFTRPDSFETYRRNLSHFIDELIENGPEQAIFDWKNKSFSIIPVGPANGGLLGRTDGIKFNDSVSLKIEVPAFKNTLYLRGYTAGIYDDNSWSISGTDDNEVSFDDLLEESGDHCTQDLNYLCVHGSDTADSASIKVEAIGASKKFIYAPYNTLYSFSGRNNEKKFTPTLDSYVRTPSKSYDLTFRNYEEDYDIYGGYYNPENIKELDSKNLTSSQMDALEEYEDFVYDEYTETLDGEEINRAYQEILNNYLPYSPEYCTYPDYYEAIKNYFNDDVQGFHYTTQPQKTPDDVDFVEDFLNRRVGYCSYFATAGAQLLRKFGFPTRYAEGYMILPSQQGTKPNSKDMFEISVKDRCAHAWAEVYIDGLGWYPAEFTPGYDNDNPNLSDADKNPGTIKKPSDNSQVQKDSSSAADQNSSSESKADSSSSSKASSSSSRAASSSKASNSSSSGAAGEYGSGSGADGHGNSSEGQRAAKKPMPPLVSGILYTIAALILICALFWLNRNFKLKAMHKATTEGSANERSVEIYRYMLKYLSLIGLYKSRNITDMKTADEICEKLKEASCAGIEPQVRFIAELAVMANMSNSEIPAEKAEQALSMLEIIRNDAVYNKLSTLGKISAKFINGLY